jgi:hypothetical protein
MRIFYIDEDEENSKRQYYVKIDNINVPDELRGFKAIKAGSIKELMERVMEYYKFSKRSDIEIQLWSNASYVGKRLDTLDEIPMENEFIWVRGVVNKNRIE